VDFSLTEYSDKIQSYRAIIPNHIYEEIEEFYIKGTLPKTITLPPRNRIESNIIKPNLICTIINWIDRKDKDFNRNNNDPFYKFDLIYQGSQDEISNESFRNKCNLQEPILVLIRCQHSRKIFGGYSPIGFYRHMKDVEDVSGMGYYDRFIFSTDSFIFYFEEDDDTQDMKLIRVIERFHKFAIYNNFYDDYYGFNFGGDLCMHNNKLYVADGDYCVYNISVSGTFTIENVEAFKVIKR
jgi:hypothetical protein